MAVNSKTRQLRVTKLQLDYLVELVDDDLRLTDLDHDERQSAEALLRKLERLEDQWNVHQESESPDE